MAEFISKKIVAPNTPIAIENTTQTLPMLEQTLYYLNRCIELEQDFVMHFRGSPWIGVALAALFIGIGYIMTRKIRLLV